MSDTLIMTVKSIDNKIPIFELIEDKFNKLKQICHDVTKCHVFIENISKNHQKGNVYLVELYLKQADYTDIFVTQNAREGDLAVESAVRSVFKKTHELARRQILKRKQKSRLSEKILLETG